MIQGEFRVSRLRVNHARTVADGDHGKFSDTVMLTDAAGDGIAEWHCDETWNCWNIHPVDRPSNISKTRH